jgi:hypothetical protein
MQHVVRFLQSYLKEHWNVLRHAQIRDPVLGMLALIEKWQVQSQDAAVATRAETRRTHGGMRVR